MGFFFFKPFLFHQGISITFKAVSHLFKCVFWQSCQRLGKRFFMEIIKRKRSRQEACSSLAVRVEQNCVSFKRWKYLKHQWNTWSTFLLPLPCPSHSHYNWKSFTCCWLEYTLLWGNPGGRVRSEEKKKKKPTIVHQPVIQSRRTEQSQKYSNTAGIPSWAPCSPCGNSQSLTTQLETAESFQQVMCTYLLVRNNSHSLLQPSFPCFPLISDLLPTDKHWSNAD